MADGVLPGTRFNGTGDYIDISSMASRFKSTILEFTLAMRIYRMFDNNGGMQVLFSLGDDGELPDANSIRFHIENDFLTMKTEIGPGTNRDVMLLPLPISGAWVQFAYVVRGDRVTVHVDGVCAIRKQFVQPETQAQRMQIGGWPWASISFDGYMANVVVLDRALTETAVRALQL